MNSELVHPAQAAAAAREVFIRLHPGHEQWFDLIWTSCNEAAQPIDLGGRALPGLGALPDNSQASDQLAKDFSVMAATFLIQSPVARDELLKRLKEACAARHYAAPVRSWLAQIANEILDRPISEADSGTLKSDILVWEMSAEDIVSPVPKACTNAEVKSGCWKRHSKYDLFIYHNFVFAPKARGDESIRLPDHDFRLLVTLLMHRGRALRTMPLYRLVWRQKSITTGAGEFDILRNYIKPAIGDLRKQVIPLVAHASIPDRRTFNGYILHGQFSSCLVMSAADAAPFMEL